MLLKDWLERQRKSPADFAEEIGVHRSTVGHWINDGTRPGPKAMRLILSATNGAVTANDFMEDVAAREIPSRSEEAA